ncbi:hypothetical protein [Leptospira ryugenii]|nr:hypothetical protein [Leptospira ryugenii]
MRITTVLFVWMALVSFQDTESKTNIAHEDGWESQERQIQVLGKEKTIRILYKPDAKKRSFAKEMLDRACAYIPRVAEYLNSAPSADTLTIKDIIDGSIARNEGSIIYVPLAYPDPELLTPPPLLYHEIGHWWFGQEPRWIGEGVSSFLPIALQASGYLQWDEFEMHKIKSWWGFFNPLSKRDFPLGDSNSKDETINSDFQIYYEKTFKIQYYIFTYLGKEKYRDFLISLTDPDHKTWNEYFIAPSKTLWEQKSKGVLSLLDSQKKINWEKQLSGWILTKGYSKERASLLSDADGDSLTDFEEEVFGTDLSQWDTDADGIGDALERVLGTDPKQSNVRSELKSQLKKKGIQLDGMDDDWDLLEIPEIKNPSLEIGKQRMALQSFRYLIKDQVLYGVIRAKQPFYEVFQSQKDLYFYLMDVSASKERSGLGFKLHMNDAYGWEHERTKGEKRYFWGKVGHVFEFKIDLSSHPDSDLKLIPLLNGSKGPSFGQWDYASPITIPIPLW